MYNCLFCGARLDDMGYCEGCEVRFDEDDLVSNGVLLDDYSEHIEESDYYTCAHEDFPCCGCGY